MLSANKLIVFAMMLLCTEGFLHSGHELHRGILTPSRPSLLPSAQIGQRKAIEKACPGSLDHTSTSSSLRAAPLDIIVSQYKDSLMDYPLETKLITGGVLAFLGDLLAQSQEASYDKKRAAALVSFDMVYRAVQCALFPSIVTHCDGHHLACLTSLLSVPDSFVTLKTLATMEQTFANQFIVIPLIYYPVFFTLTGCLQGLSMEATVKRVENTLVPLLTRNWLFWIPVQYFQFGYVEEPLQIPFLCVVGLAWTFILSAAAGSIETYGDEEAISIEEQNVIATKSPSTVDI